MAIKVEASIKPTLVIALIHNDDLGRLAHIRPALIDLQNSFHQLVGSTIIEISYQPPLTTRSARSVIGRQVLLAHHQAKWARYRKLRITYLRQFCRHMWQSVLRNILCRRIDVSTWLSSQRRRDEIEIRLADKHIRAWIAALECGADYALILEDDAIFKDITNERLVKLFLEIKSDSFYIDLAGGNAYDDLRAGAIEADNCVTAGTKFKQFRYPLSNCACAYAVHRNVLESFVVKVMEHPWLRLVPADWMIDGIFMLMGRKAKSVMCLHSRPPLLDHGSVLGQYVSKLR